MLQIKQYLDVETSKWLPMVGSEARGLPLVKQGDFAADMLSFESGQKTTLHMHSGNHILFVVKGNGWLEYNGEKHNLIVGTCYFVPGSVPHRVEAISSLLLLSIADSHQPVESSKRLQILKD